MNKTASAPALSRRVLLGAGAAAALSACAPGARYAERAEARWPPEGRFVTVDGLRVHYVEAGDPAAPPAILIHGATGNLRDMSFDLLGRVAGAGWRAIAFDRPGLGYTDRPPPEAEPWRPAVQGRILRRAAEALGAGGGASGPAPLLIGHSWGAAVAMGWATDAPDAVRGVVTISGATMPWGERETIFDLVADSAPAVALKGAAARAWIGLDGGESVAERIFQPQAAPEGYVAHVGGPLTLRPKSFRANSEDLARLHEALSEQALAYPDLTVPVIALHGDRDDIASERVHAMGMAAVLPHGEARVAEGVGHMLHHARPGMVLEAVADLRA